MSLGERVTGAVARLLDRPLSLCDRFQTADAIVVLGATLRQDGRLNSALAERMHAGLALWQRGAAPLFCVTGGGPDGRVEADAMARWALDRGIPQQALRVERASRNTGENARYVARLLAADRCARIWLVSQPFHLRRARLLFRKYGFDVLVWHADDSLQYRHPRLGLRWVSREYAAFMRFAAIEAMAVARGEWRASRRASYLQGERASASETETDSVSNSDCDSASASASDSVSDSVPDSVSDAEAISDADSERQTGGSG